jgi:hypothetical protein
MISPEIAPRHSRAADVEDNFVAGMIEHETRMAIRDLIRVRGFADARELVANYLVDELERRRP